MWCWCQAISAVIKLGEEFYFAFPPSATQYSSRNPSWCVLSKPVDIASSQTSGPQRDVGSTAVQDALVQGWMTFVSTPLCGEVIKSAINTWGLWTLYQLILHSEFFLVFIYLGETGANQELPSHWLTPNSTNGQAWPRGSQELNLGFPHGCQEPNYLSCYQ